MSVCVCLGACIFMSVYVGGERRGHWKWGEGRLMSTAKSGVVHLGYKEIQLMILCVCKLKKLRVKKTYLQLKRILRQTFF